MTNPINLFDFEALARERIDATAWDYYASGADDELTLHGAREAFQALPLYPRVLVDVALCGAPSVADIDVTLVRPT